MSFSIQNIDTSGYAGLIGSARSIYEPESKIDDRSYLGIYNALKNFRRHDDSTPGGAYDDPTLKFFKIFFHFGEIDTYSNGIIEASQEKDEQGNVVKENPFRVKDGMMSSIYTDAGLLAPTFLLEDKGYPFSISENIGGDGGTAVTYDYEYYRFNSAWAYLKNNCEEERAMLLRYFISLLSDISSNYPWYFPVIEGLDAAVDRNISNKGFNVEEERKKITIKCLQDAVDDRIGTLLDLYRSIAYSWASKREILPSNLRKFNMSIYVIEAPLSNITKKLGALVDYLPQLSDFTNYGTDYAWFAKLPTSGMSADDELFCSYKLFEFHNCEIDYNTTKSALATLDNQAGITPVYDLNIYFDDCFEHRFNSFHGAEFGDMLMLDTAATFVSSELEHMISDGTAAEKEEANTQYKNIQDGFTNVMKKASEKMDMLRDKARNLKGKWAGFGDMADGALKQMIQNGLPEGLVGSKLGGKGLQDLEDLAKGAVLGNLYGLSISNVASQVDKLKSGDIYAGVNLVTDLIGHDMDDLVNNNKEARDLVGDDKKPKFNIEDKGVKGYKDKKARTLTGADKKTLYSISERGSSYKPMGPMLDDNGTPNLRESLWHDPNQSTASNKTEKPSRESIREDIIGLVKNPIPEKPSVENISTSNRNDEEFGGYIASIIGDDNPQLDRERMRKELVSYNLKDSIKNELDYRERDKEMKGMKSDIIGKSINDNFGSRMVDKERDMKDTIIEETDRKAELSKKKLGNLAQSMIANIR